MGIWDNIAKKLGISKEQTINDPRVARNLYVQGLADWCQSTALRYGGGDAGPQPDKNVSKTVGAQLLEIDGGVDGKQRVVHRAFFGTLTYTDTGPGKVPHDSDFRDSSVFYSFRGAVENTFVTTTADKQPDDISESLDVEIVVTKQGDLVAYVSPPGAAASNRWPPNVEMPIGVTTGPDSNGTLDCQIEKPTDPDQRRWRFKTVLSPTLAITR